MPIGCIIGMFPPIGCIIGPLFGGPNVIKSGVRDGASRVATDGAAGKTGDGETDFKFQPTKIQSFLHEECTNHADGHETTKLPDRDLLSTVGDKDKRRSHGGGWQ